MLNELLGRKLGMTQIYKEDGTLIPVTVLEVGPCTISQIKTIDRDGYSAVQLGFGKKKKLNKAQEGHYKKGGNKLPAFVREVRCDDVAELKTGQELTVSVFSDTKKVDVSGLMKGRGFSGVIKRHGMHRGPMSHGSMNIRRPGSIGQSATPSRVIKGKKMPGQYGNTKKTILNLEIASIDEGRNVLMVKGAVPGAIGNYIVIRKSQNQKITEVNEKAFSVTIRKND